MAYDIGFLGGGQLARMSIQAAQRMGLKCISLDPGDDTPASQIADAVTGRLDDPAAIAQVLSSCDRITLENEFIPAQAIRDACRLAGREESCILPGIDTLATIQDKLTQRRALTAAGVPSPTAVELTSADAAIEAIGLPLVLKSRFGGYDGKGTRYARTLADLEGHAPLWENGGWLAEAFVPFKRELAVMVFVSETESGCYPTMETVQQNHVCDLVFPAEADASQIGLAAVRALEGYGLFGVELFELEDGQVLVNEIAPRPHNTGHYTLDWGGTSQFEQHIRLVMGFPLGRAEGDAVCMANLLGIENAGSHLQALKAISDSDAHVHWYGKADSRPGRKMGHLNLRGRPGESCHELVERTRSSRNAFLAAL